MHWVRRCVLFLLLIGGLRRPPWKRDHTDTPVTSTSTLGGGRPSVKEYEGKEKPRAQTLELAEDGWEDWVPWSVFRP